MSNEESLNFVFSEDVKLLETADLEDYCLHLLCKEGEGSFVYNDRCFYLQRNSLVVIAHPRKASNWAFGPQFKMEMFAANYVYLQKLLPSNNYSIGGSVSLNHNPVIPLSDDNAQRFLEDVRRLRERAADQDFLFYRELMGSLCLTMMYDIFEFHAIYYSTHEESDRSGYVVKEFLQLLSTGITREQRDVTYLASRLNVSMKYLSGTIKRVTGHTVMSFIDRATIAIVKEYLDNDQLSLTQIADRMRFASLSYFSRYCKKHLGMTPSEYRRSRQPNAEA